jgi:16S rRNA (cytosine967-C5)-methyltransferase
MRQAQDSLEPGLAARAAALHLLQAVLRRHRPLDEALAAHPGLATLAPRDRAFARLIVATALRRLGQIDAVLAGLTERPLPSRAAMAHDILRLGLCQMLFLDTPAHAAVDTAVRLAGASGAEAQSGLVNAVLRRVAREGRERLANLPVTRNLPDWLWRSWTLAYGDAAAEAIAAAHLQDPPLDLSVRSEPESWAGRLGAELLPTGSLRLSRRGEDERAVADLPGYTEGAWWVQDAAAALPARLLGPVAGRGVIDLCAAPGGKTAQLACAGARVTAIDRSAGRMARLRENLARLGLGARTVVADAASWRPREPADAVLLDAPCSATGTIRRHPDIPWLKRESDLPRLTALQDRLLEAALAMTAPGGTLVYCVCSLQPEEGPSRIAALLAAGAPVRRQPIAADEIGGLAEAVTPEGDLRTLPCHWPERGGLDGFYACRLRRTG